MRSAQSAPNLMHRVARISAFVLGAVFLIAGLFKVADPWRFLGSLPAYGVPTVLRMPIVVAMPTIEILLGLMLVSGWRTRQAALATCAFLVAFGGAIAYGWSAGTLAECSCFGPFIERTPPQAMAQDVGLLALGLLAAFSGAPQRTRLGRGHYGFLGVVGAASAAFVAATLLQDPGTLEQRLAGTEPTVGGVQQGRSIEDLDVRNRDYLLFLFHPQCPHCVDNGPRVARYVADPALPEVIGITHSVRPGEVEEYQRNAGTTFTTFEFLPPNFVRITGNGSVPQLVYLKRGQIENAWLGELPGSGALKSYIASR